MDPIDAPDLQRLFDQQEAQAESEGATNLHTFGSMSMIRCKCGEICDIRIPTRCVCGDIKAFWKTVDSRILRLDQMTLGHLNNCVRALAAKADELPPSQREKYEIALDLLYSEIGSRDKEIAQVTGIMAALTRSLPK